MITIKIKGMFDSICPITQKEDHYQIKIQYNYSNKILELFGLKKFLKTFENETLFLEEITQKINDYILNQLEHNDFKVIIIDDSPGFQIRSEING